jgi:hypothetical protein
VNIYVDCSIGSPHWLHALVSQREATSFCALACPVSVDGNFFSSARETVRFYVESIGKSAADVLRLLLF